MKLQTQTVSTEKLRKILKYKKAHQFFLVKLTPSKKMAEDFHRVESKIIFISSSSLDLTEKSLNQETKLSGKYEN